VRTAFEVARVGAGLGSDVCFHVLRHTWASWYAQRGGNLNLLQDLGGWSTPGMVARYAHLSPGYRASAVPLMGRQAHAAGQVEAAGGEASKKLLGEAASGKARP
ncbi:MAG: tyrosine-type recombinase/integrase, partial [Candidatus Polarisedimenticolia bacterium]